MKIKKKIEGGWGVRGEVSGLGVQGGCERRIEVFVKIQKKKLGGGLGFVLRDGQNKHFHVRNT